MERIGVYCSSSVKIDKKYFDAAQQLGEWIGSNGKWLVYGGSNRGTMGTLAAAVKQSGGRVMGVVPTALEERDIVSDDLDVNFRCENLSDRKDIMIQESDILVAMPGGVGTLDEIFTTLAALSRQKGRALQSRRLLESVNRAPCRYRAERLCQLSVQHNVLRGRHLRRTDRHSV